MAGREPGGTTKDFVAACLLEGLVRKMIIVSTGDRQILLRQGSTFSKIFILFSLGLLIERFKLRILPHRSQGGGANFAFFLGPNSCF